MSSFKKARLLTEEEYQDWRNHKCNEDQLQKIDMLNKKYADTILSEEANREQNIEAANDSGAVDGATEDMPVETPDRSFVNGSSSVSNVAAEESNSNPLNANELSNDPKGSDNKEGDSTSTLAPPPSTPITQAQPSTNAIYDCIPNTNTLSESTIAADQIPKTKPYKCTVPKCVKSYASRWGLKRHLMKYHGFVGNKPKAKIIRKKMEDS